MAKFKVTLNAVEKYGNILLDEAKGHYAKATENVNNQIKKIEEAERELKELYEEINRKNSEGVSILELQGMKSYAKIIDNRIEEGKEKLVGLKKIQSRCQMELTRAKTDARSIEKIKEKRIEEFRKEETKKEQEAVLEFVSNQISAHKNE